MDFERLLQYWYWVPIAIVGLILLIKLLPRYKIAPPDTALIISGFLRRRYKVRNHDGTVAVKQFGYRIVRGGATFWVPAVERIDKLDMCLMQVDIKTAQPVPTKEYISVLVDAVANIKIGSDDLSIATAAEQLLHYDSDHIKALAKDVLEGNMREIIGQMTIAELVQNRDKFAQESIKAAMSDMGNMGLEIINLTIQNFSDKDNNVIETMALQNIVDKERDAKIARAKAEQEGHKAEIEAQAIIAEQNKELELRKAAYKMESDQEKAKADETYKIEQERIRKEKEAEQKRLAEEKRKKEQAISNKVAGAFGIGSAAGNSQGDAASGTGNQGSPFGNSDHGANEGVGGYGSFNLNGRSIGSGGLPRPAYTIQEEGRIVVNITVDPKGNVIFAEVGRGTNIDNASMRRSALEAARKAKFNQISGANNQSGTITYVYKFK